MNDADERAVRVRSWASAVNQTPMLEPESTDEVSYWRVGEVLVLMPRLLPRAPQRVRRLYRDRVIANATGRCPRCFAVADVAGTQMEHETACPVGAEGERDMGRWLAEVGQRQLALARMALRDR